jgi:pimeloyl-ACP methyl ester carboxylesterase
VKPPFTTSSLSHEITGSGPDVVLIHGLAGSGRWWSKNLDDLATRFRVCTVDLAGFGESRRYRRFALGEAVDLLEDWLDYVDIKHAVIVGHSMGGLIAAGLAARSPQRVDRLVLVDAAFLSFEPGVAKRAFGLTREFVASSPDLIRLAAHDGLRADPISLSRATLELLRLDWSKILPRITAPTLIVWGEHDTVTPLTIGRQIEAKIPGARLIIISGAGHVPMWDRPDLFNAEILAFLT